MSISSSQRHPWLSSPPPSESLRLRLPWQLTPSAGTPLPPTPFLPSPSGGAEQDPLFNHNLWFSDSRDDSVTSPRGKTVQSRAFGVWGLFFLFSAQKSLPWAARGLPGSWQHAAQHTPGVVIRCLGTMLPVTRTCQVEDAVGRKSAREAVEIVGSHTPFLPTSILPCLPENVHWVLFFCSDTSDNMYASLIYRTGLT